MSLFGFEMIGTQSAGYNEKIAVSNSVLSEFEKSTKKFRDWWKDGVKFKEDEEDEGSDSFLLGTLVDILLTRKDKFYDIYYVFTEKAPKPQMEKFCRKLARMWPENPKELNPEDLNLIYKLAYDETGFGRDSFENVMERFKLEGVSFFNALIVSKNKKVISIEDYNKAVLMVDELTTNEFTKDIVNVDSVSEDIEILHQLEIFDEYIAENGISIPIKGQLDKVILDHQNKIAYPIDYKTSLGIHHFARMSYLKYKYFRQASFYSMMLQRWLHKKGYTDYIVAPFKFIAVSSVGQGAYRFRVSEADLQAAAIGGTSKTGYYYKGWVNLLEEISWHIANDKWDYPYEVYINNGEIELNEFLTEFVLEIGGEDDKNSY